MASMNRVSFIGNLGAAPEMKYGANGDAITNFRMGVNERGAGGKEETLWLRVTVFKGTAEAVAQNLDKGSLVCVNGRLQVRKYTDKDNVERTSVEVLADNFGGVVFLDPKPQD